MSNEENSVESVESVEKVEKKNEVARGDRGELGTATAGLTILQKWREHHFTRESAGDRRNPNKRVFVRRVDAPSLKQFARQLLKDGDPVAKEWFANKRGAKNQKRTDANIKAAKECAMASKAARQKKK